MAQLELRRAVAERDEALAASRRAEQRQALLVRELHHRVGNTLATIQALLRSTARSSRSVQDFHRAFSARIASLARTHILVTDDHRQVASLQAMLNHELRAFLEDRPQRVSLSGPPIDLPADLAIPVGMALHELTTNAIRHGALSGPEGRVEITWGLVGADGAGRLHLEWRESGGPPAMEPRHRGFGSALLEHVLATQCRGDVRIAFDRTGFRFTLDAPLAERGPISEC
jgi:two-component sensor histidine kinase